MQFEVNLDNRHLLHVLNALTNALEHPSALLHGIGAEVVDITERNFADESGPAGEWQSLAEATINSREKKGQWPGKKLQIDGSLARSVLYTVEDSSVTIQAGSGGSEAYAAIHQFGGMAGRGRKVKIPARPYLPFVSDGSNVELSADATSAIADTFNDYLLDVLKK
ncbi:phage virion morphogenesis protein [Methylophilus aquaticus]|uniref:Phage virion morphogenesis protein n=1 Tax=Methylophilus aquaticus TaxID=1971610 RepID=A0ABT9JUV7_9PROT|nr:phage virion morphogenesis protein [Methylophilus aquaticus]MDP8567911.1 phage virion morphogenesis protein [Methylophilus aquaticus]